MYTRCFELAVSKAHPHVFIRTKDQRLIFSNCSPLLSKCLVSHLSVAFQLLCLGIVSHHVAVSCNRPGGLYSDISECCSREIYTITKNSCFQVLILYRTPFNYYNLTRGRTAEATSDLSQGKEGPSPIRQAMLGSNSSSSL